MPRIPKHPCPYPGCGALVEYRTTYCPKHQIVYAERNREYDKTRPEAKFYHSTRWRKLRDWFIKTHPLCETCLKNGRVEPAVVVDHIMEIADGGARLDAGNLQALCIACHNQKTFEEKIKRNEKKLEK